MIYAYYRVSTQSQADANGVQMQKDVVSKYARDNGLTIADTFKDEAISGTVVERPGVMDLLSTLEPGDKIIVQNTSRLWRDDVAKVMIRKEIMRAKADVISVEQPSYSIYSKDPNDFLINSIFEILDQYDKMQITMKLHKGLRAKANKGSKPCGIAPYGYKWDNNEIVVDYNNNLVVKDIFVEYKFCKSLSTLEDICKAKGYKTSRGNDFTKKSLANILHNRFYIGYVKYGEVELEGAHETFISEALFNEVQEILER